MGPRDLWDPHVSADVVEQQVGLDATMSEGAAGHPSTYVLIFVRVIGAGLVFQEVVASVIENPAQGHTGDVRDAWNERMTKGWKFCQIVSIKKMTQSKNGLKT